MYDANWASVPSGRTAASPWRAHHLPWGLDKEEIPH